MSCLDYLLGFCTGEFCNGFANGCPRGVWCRGLTTCLQFVGPFFDIMENNVLHHIDVIMSAMASQITGVSVVYSTVVSDADQRKHQSFASLAFVWGIHQWPRNMFPFGDVIMNCFQLRFTHSLMPHNMMVLYYCHLPYFHVANSTFVLSFYINVVLTLSVCNTTYCSVCIFGNWCLTTMSLFGSYTIPNIGILLEPIVLPFDEITNGIYAYHIDRPV